MTGDRVILVCLTGGWICLTVAPGGVAGALALVAFSFLWMAAPPRSSVSSTVTAVAASLAVASASQAGLLFLAWIASGVALTAMVRREGGETSGKPGRVLEAQQHAASVLLLVLLAALVTVGQDWDLGRLAPRVSTGVAFILSSAGLRHGPLVWNRVATVVLVSLVALRLGLFPFPFSLRRSTRRLRDLPLAVLLAVFLPTSMIALSKVFDALYRSAPGVVPATAALGCVALVTGALWLRVEWLAESVLGHVAQSYMGLALISLSLRDPGLTRRVVLHAVFAVLAGSLWAMRLRQQVGSSDLSKAGPGYAAHRELALRHAVFCLLSCPLPGTPGGTVWMGVLGQGIAGGRGVSVVVFVGIALLYCALFHSMGKVADPGESHPEPVSAATCGDHR